MAASSVACAASSMSTPAKANFEKKSPPAKSEAERSRRAEKAEFGFVAETLAGGDRGRADDICILHVASLCARPKTRQFRGLQNSHLKLEVVLDVALPFSFTFALPGTGPGPAAHGLKSCASLFASSHC